MSDEAEHDCDCPPEGLPAYMGTFADLMALLMCFFVLLLSFAEMDVLKFKRLAGSLSKAFGVQRQIEVNAIPKGTSVIAQEFSPGRPEPTPINDIRQKTVDQEQQNLEVQCMPNAMNIENAEPEELVEKLAMMIAQTQQDAMDLARALKEQIRKGQVEIETRGRDIIIRISESGSFSSGSATLSREFSTVLKDVRDVLANKSGKILVQGHTDNVPIKTSRFRSNWELSSARAVSVAHVLLSDDVVNPLRFKVSGYSYTHPLVKNDTIENRARNRRVEIVINQGYDARTESELEDLREENPKMYDALELKARPLFKLDPDEIF